MPNAASNEPGILGRGSSWLWFDKPLKDLCHTEMLLRMTIFNFRVDDEEAEEKRQWADRFGMGRSELLRDALHRYLLRLRAESDIEAWIEKPLSIEESSLSEISTWAQQRTGVIGPMKRGEVGSLRRQVVTGRLAS